EGQIRTRKYQDKDGVEKYATDIRVDQMQMLGSRSEGGAAPAPAPRAPAAAPRASSGGGFDDMDDDIPF
ncbi:MAG: single-stranded DNA-binding protein, partial [Variovorax paradoxus]